jgi:ubiquinone/menaquinone biosynthesis C-methylase UbiE
MSPFSVIIPVKDDASPSELNQCLDSLKGQTLAPLETIIIMGSQADPQLLHLCQKYQVKVVQKDLPKAAARNYGAKIARGKYLINLDVDHSLARSTLREASLAITRTHAPAFIIYQDIAPITFIARVRKVERKFIRHDNNLLTPIIISTSLFHQLGGYDERVDILDDWSLHFKLQANKVNPGHLKSLNHISVETNLFQILKRKYLRAQYIPLFKILYPEFNLITNTQRLSIYYKYRQYFADDLLASLGLIFLKPLEWLVYYLGTLLPKGKNKDPSLKYLTSSVASRYDQKQQSLLNRFKHYQEVVALLNFLKSTRGQILELASGTGRITHELVTRSYPVTATDISEAMLTKYREKKHLPRPILVSPSALPFSSGQFETVIAIRIIWHLSNQQARQQFFSEAFRVTQKYFIADFAIKGRGFNFLSKDDYLFTMKEIKRLAKNQQAKVVATRPLPWGRLLVKISKE